MAWSQRGNGYTYDSLNGFCCLIGVQSGKVIAYKTFNRMCKKCMIIQKTGVDEQHDCHQNYSGSAKGMEAEGAIQVVTNSQSLKEANIEIGGFIADNDSGSKKAVEESTNYPVLIQSDIAHTKKNFKNMLYEIGKDKEKDPNGELSKDVITQFVRSFAAAIHQNKGKLGAMKSAIKNIISHAKGDHSECNNSWCRASVDKENYESSIQLENEIVIDEVEKLVERVSNNAESYLTAGSSQPNENINNTMASKNPKRLSLSLSGSTDYRFCATVAQKNLHEQYVIKVLDRLGIESKSFLEDYFATNENIAKRRYVNSCKPETKRRRLEKKTERSQLRFRKEKSDDYIYESNTSFFDSVKPKDCILELEKLTSFKTDDIVVVFYDLETGGFDLMLHDILQIAMVGEKWAFNAYITPKRSIHDRASKVHNLTKSGRNLFKNGKQVYTFTKNAVLNKLLEFLKKFGKKCLLVAHNDSFDAPRLVNLIEHCGKRKEFKEVIFGFSDTLGIFKSKFKDLTHHNLEYLATTILSLSCEEAHDAAFDIHVLQRLVIEKKIQVDELVSIHKTYDDVLKNLDEKRNLKKNLSKLSSLKNIISTAMIRRLAENAITMERIQQVYDDAPINSEQQEVIKLLRGDKGGKAQIIKSKKIFNKLIDHLNQHIFQNKN